MESNLPELIDKNLEDESDKAQVLGNRTFSQKQASQ